MCRFFLSWLFHPLHCVIAGFIGCLFSGLTLLNLYILPSTDPTVYTQSNIDAFLEVRPLASLVLFVWFAIYLGLLIYGFTRNDQWGGQWSNV